MLALGWIDFDESERQRARRIMDLFQECDSRDELGLGSIRDSIADHLFPGTSTIQTRLRYMLFVPWILCGLEGLAVGRQIAAEARAMEVRLAEALKAGGEIVGIIGRDAGSRLQRLPSSVYWAGLAAWRIRLFPGSIDSYFTSITRTRRLHPNRGSEHAAQEFPLWCSTLPPAPGKLLDTTTFRLTADEAQFLVDRLIATQPSALLTLLARDRINADCDHIWTHPHLSAFSAPARRLVRHGEIFSQVMHGAALLYNLELAELRGRDDWVASYRDRLKTWAADLDLAAVRAWSLDDFWPAATHRDHSVRPAAKRFVTQWLDLVLDGATRIPTSAAARQLVEERERRLKTSQSRFTNRAVRDRWGGASGTDRFSFRWSQAKSHLRDLARAA